jgi:4-hydroxythreonine-4-phosphate dehydrogenase
MRIRAVSSPEAAMKAGAGLPMVCLPRCASGAGFKQGVETAEAGRAAYEWLKAAAGWAAQGRAGAIVTGPVSKATIAWSVPDFRGQTELLAGCAGVRDPVMMLAGPRLRVVPLTRHIPISGVPRALSRKLVYSAIITTARGLRKWFGITRPRIAVCGLNPHAGEGGLIGTEESRVIAPAIAVAARAGVRVSGPLAADTIFTAALEGKYDAVIAMYHDQALIALKTLERDSAVNVTLGLPFLRTSPAHGTAFDIAGRGMAKTGSMETAIRLAVRAAARRRLRGA